MEKKHIVAVDSGKFLTKAVLLNDEGTDVAPPFTIETKISATTQKEVRDSSRYILTLDGVSTLMGAEDGTIDLERSKKGETHKRSTYLAISQLLPSGSHLYLAIGTPLQTHDSVEQLVEYQKFMLGYEVDEEISFPVEIKFLVNNVEHVYYIENIYTFPESSGYLLNNASDHDEDDLVGVIDIGGLNVNASLYERENNLDLTSPFQLIRGQRMVTSDLGVHALMRSAHDKLETILKTTIDFSTMNLILTRGFYGNQRNLEQKERTAKIIKEAKKDHLERIIQDLKANHWDFNLMTPVFTGGGSLLLKEEIEEHPELEYAITTNNAQWENVLGFIYELDAIVNG